MIGARFARWSTALALIAGLLGMHGLVVGDAHHDGSPVVSAVHSAMPAPVSALHDTAAPAADPPGAAHAGSPDHTSHSGPHQMLHLCLAVLAALLAVAAFAGLAWSLGRRDTTADLVAVGICRREPPRRPPPTSVRLAQLCVMRN